MHMNRSIVNDLRSSSLGDDDDMSVLRRQSFSSEYSIPPSPSQERGSNSVQLMFKEHKRMSSKSSGNSYLATTLKRRGTNSGGAGPRPETKVCNPPTWTMVSYKVDVQVFFSSTHQIGRLIDSLSKGIDSGSFNIVPVDAMGAPAGSNGSAGPSVRVSSDRGTVREDGNVPGDIASSTNNIKHNNGRVSTPASLHSLSESQSGNSANYTMEERVERMLSNLEAANAMSPFNHQSA